MTSNVNFPLLATGVPGLDEVLGGGVPELSFNLISGPPGCGKTTLGNQMLFGMCSAERTGIYFTVLGEPPLKMLRYQQRFSFFDLEAVGPAVRFVSLAEEALTGDLGRVMARIQDEVQASSPALVFIDSFRSIALSGTADKGLHNSLHEFLLQLALLMTSWQATTFLVGEYFGSVESSPVFTVADGVLSMSQCVTRNSMVRKLEVSKMRGNDPQPGLHPYRIGPGGIDVFGAPLRLGPYKSAGTDDDARVLVGIAALDQMLGGGLPRGHSVLVSGPSGSGKSLLAAAFLEEGVRSGEPGVIAVFEQRPHHPRNSPLGEMIANGMVSVVDSRAPDFSSEELLVRLRREVARTGARRVVIDSLSGFELALAPTFQDDFRQSLARLVTSLSSEGVSMLLTSELEDRYNELRFSPYSSAFLIDAIIVQRYVEVDSQLRRVIAVVKVRQSAHSHELREYTIDDNGLQIGETLPDQEGLLGGRPRRRQAAQLSNQPADA